MYNSVKSYEYDALGRNISVTDPLNATSRVSYDELGAISERIGPLGASTAYTYDRIGRLISETTASGGNVSYGYNALGLKTEQRNARGQKTEYTYDALGRIVGMTNAEDTRSYTYDANGNILTATDKNGTVTRVYDALNRVIKYTDTEGNTVCYSYDSVGNLTRIIYPDGTAVVYSYDVNNNLVSVIDWEGRATTYTYDENNKVVSVAKPDGSITETVYDDAQRVVSTVERTADGSVISGFEYTYDKLSRIIAEKSLASGEKICYNYDEDSRVVKKCICDSHSNECGCEGDCYSYDKAGNITGARIDCTSHTRAYDKNNRLTEANGVASTYDADGNMLSNGTLTCTYDSANRLTSACGHTYTYNAEDVRIRNLCADEDTTYTYNTNCKLSKLLCKTTNGVVTKYVYGRGLIGEESNNTFKTYHFDFRGSTIAITDASGNITDTFAYDTYGKLTSRTGTTPVIFSYNGRDGVVTDDNGLIYMRARYYSPEMKRFINADIVAGQISNAITLNRFAYANGNPVSFVDPFGLSAERAGITKQEFEYFLNIYNELLVFSKKQKKAIFEVKMGSTKYYQNVETTLG